MTKKNKEKQKLENNPLKTRQIPYPPNFKSTPAKIIEPATGASTCALGSHKCTENIGNLIKNAKRKKNIKIILITLLEDKLASIILEGIKNLKDSCSIRITTSKGNEAKRV
jgi:hypothetical protein